MTKFYCSKFLYFYLTEFILQNNWGRYFGTRLYESGKRTRTCLNEWNLKVLRPLNENQVFKTVQYKLSCSESSSIWRNKTNRYTIVKSHINCLITYIQYIVYTCHNIKITLSVCKLGNTIDSNITLRKNTRREFLNVKIIKWFTLIWTLFNLC